MENVVKLGTARIEYAKSGIVTQANFKPTMEVKADKRLLDQLALIKGTNNETELKGNAELVFSSWFAQINEIELADRDEYGIESEVTKCERFPSGQVKSCVIEFTFRKKVAA